MAMPEAADEVTQPASAPVALRWHNRGPLQIIDLAIGGERLSDCGDYFRWRDIRANDGRRAERIDDAPYVVTLEKLIAPQYSEMWDWQDSPDRATRNHPRSFRLIVAAQATIVCATGQPSRRATAAPVLAHAIAEEP